MKNDTTNYREFCSSLQKLLKDPDFLDESKNPYELENIKTRDFLEAMSAWLESTECGDGFFEDSTQDGISWRDLIKLIEASAIYE